MKFDKKKLIRILVVVLVVVIILLLVWFLYLYPNKVFKDNEKTLEEAGIRYYEVNRRSLPSDEGRVITIPLSTLVNQNYIDDLYGAYNKLCDVKNSNVKVVNKDGDINYYTYLN